ncbi:MAG: 2Fe-2S iron-sulfur cluster-binding protein [Bdellovibrionia bacterium]
MPRIKFAKTQKEITCELGDNLMQVLLKNQVPVASSCGGDGVCAKCRITIVNGKEYLTPANPTEEFLKVKFKLSGNDRISCQVSILGDIEIDASYW